MSRARAARGFTLVELMVSLVAGMIVAIAVVSLAKAATTAFHEQVRLTTVEQSVRNAANRLRYDLTKVSFMGTGNITLASRGDLLVPYGHRVAYTGNGVGGARYPDLTTDLQGLRIFVGGSKAMTEGSGALATRNGLNPDSIVITGNLTTDDQYQGLLLTGGACGGGQIELLRDTDPANARLLNDAPDATTATANVANAFTPKANTLFLARVVDDGGCQHYVAIRDAVATAADRAVINICPDNGGVGVLEPGIGANETPIKGCGVRPGTGMVRVSPLHRVQWFVRKNEDPVTGPVLAPEESVSPPEDQFMLYRQLQDAEGNAIDPPQIIAEYAIDLKFGIVVDNPALPAPNNVQVFDLDSDNGSGDITQWTQRSSTTLPGQPGPQRVRSVKFRVSTRAAIPDRTANLSVLPGTPYITRYCLDDADLASCKRFARVRTIVSEAALINQARMTY